VAVWSLKSAILYNFEKRTGGKYYLYFVRDFNCKIVEYSINHINHQKPILFLTQTKYRFLRHSIFLISFFVFLYQMSPLHEYNDEDRIPMLLIVYSFFVLMFYVNMYVLIPSFLMKGQWPWYILILCLIDAAGLYMLSSITTTYFPKVDTALVNEWKLDLFDEIFLSIMLILTSTTMKLFQRWTIDMEQIAELNQLSLNLELNVLKNQINPHFLFNMLNNVKSLVRKDPVLASTVIVKLSGFLRHQLYGTGDEKVLLRSEIEFLSNFLSLEKIRRDNLLIEIETDDIQENGDIDTVFLPANIFTAFVENAVKHSADSDGEESFIALFFSITDNRLLFVCRNSKNPKIVYINPAKDSGLGLTNTRRRLDLLYQEQYSLNISSTANEYTVTLNIPL